MELRPTEAPVKDNELDIICKSEICSKVLYQYQGYGNDHDGSLELGTLVITEVPQDNESIENLIIIINPEWLPS